MADATLAMKQKVVLVGDPGVGKTSLALKFVHKFYDDEYLSTVGANVYKKKVDFKDAKGKTGSMELVVWDLAGQKQGLSHIQTQAFLGCAGALAVCDVSRPESVPAIGEWVKRVRAGAGNVHVILIANKLDLLEDGSADAAKRKESLLKAEEMAKKEGFTFYKTSAKTGENVDEAFARMASMIYGSTSKAAE
jgi:small GTP-binding protein